MTITELIRLTGQPARQIRYMIAEGFIPPPRGGRANADYGDDHVKAIRRYVALRRQGLPPQAIRVLLSANGSVPFEIAAGISLNVDPQILGTEMDVDALGARVRDVLRSLFVEQSDDDTQSKSRKPR